MKAVFFINLMSVLFGSLSFANSGATKLATKNDVVVKILTQCDLEKESLRNKVIALENKVKELESQLNTKPKETSQPSTIVNNHYHKLLQKELIKVRQVTKIKHNIISVVGVENSYVKMNVNDAHFLELESKNQFFPGVMYQYQTDAGIVPMIGVTASYKANLMFGLGYEY